jgi:putative heme-binding domain-containing protein
MLQCRIGFRSTIGFLWVLVAASSGAMADGPASADSLLTIERLFGSREFETESLPSIQWSQRSATYFTLDKVKDGKGRDLVRTDPATGKSDVIVPASAFVPQGAKDPLAIDAFTFSADESKLLIFTNSKRVWRRNTRGDYWVIHVATRELTKLGGEATPSSMMFAKFSPDGSRVAFVRENNLYVQDLKSLAITALTSDGSKTRINGTGDWVNEEELDLRDGFRWSPDGRHLLFWQFDTIGVSEFHLVNNVVSNTPQITSFAYPKVGGMNSATRLGVIPASGGPVRWLDLPGDPREHYLPHAEWTPDGKHVLVQQFNRLQTELRVYLVDPSTGQSCRAMTETDAAWLENENPVRWLDGGRSILWLSERSGWRQAYRAPLVGSPLTPITKGSWDIIKVEAVDSSGGWLYYSASPANATQQYLFRVTLDGTVTEQLSPAHQPGWHSYDISPDATWAIHTWSNATMPPVVELVRLRDHSVVRTLTDNRKLRDQIATLKRPEHTFFKISVGEGVELDGWCLKPSGTDAPAQFPMLMHVYGEPHGQTVRDAWPGTRGLWHWMLAQQGYVVASVDNRGTNVPRGREWRKSVHRQIGILASHEQAQAVRGLLKRWPFVDPARVGTWGWSGGGSMSLNAVFRFPDLYRTAIAIAPVADQQLYDTIYQERYMGLPADNPTGYREGSPLTHASQLQGNLLLIHGTGDDNCHYQGTERLIDELIARDKQFTVLPYPNRSHSISEGKNTARHLYATMTRYLHENLHSARPKGPTAPPQSQAAEPSVNPVASATWVQQLLREPVAKLATAARERGDASRGAVLFFQPFMTCAKCHDAETGTQFGPDLSKAGKEATAEYLIESVLSPSKVIKKGYEPIVVNTTDGRAVTGLLVEQKNDSLTLIDPAGGKRIILPLADIETRTIGVQSLMPDGLVNLLSDRQQFLDLIKYLIEVAEGGPARAKELRPAQTTFVLPEYEKEIDHTGLIRQLDDKAFKRGEAIYARVCANCHGTKDQPGSLPTSPRFAGHTFKNGSDPHSLYRTLTHGYNQMAPQSWMVPRQKYDVIHYLREAYLKPHNPTQYTKADDAFFAKLPAGKNGAFGPAPASVEPWMAMDYGPSLMNTYEVGGPGPNIAYKGIAVRLDAGTGGVSRGKTWALFDHDTMRFAAGWTGDGFIDWKGIHFNGQHQVHPKLVDERHIENPVGPGWANPETGRFDDPRPLGRDGRPYGPLPRSWAQFKGKFAYGDQTVIAYTVGDAAILELAGAERYGKSKTVFTRTLEIGRSSRDLHARIASDKTDVAVVGDSKVSLGTQGNVQILTIPAAATPTRVKVLMANESNGRLILDGETPAPRPLKPLTEGGPKRWPEVLKTTVSMGKNDGPFAVDTFGIPDRNPWNALLRPTGFDFLPDGKKMAVCTWDGDVWMVSGIDKPEHGLTWQRIASGLFQPLGLKIRDGSIFVCCRDQIVKLHDLNGDGETDFYECFNNDHQVTEHFHEFAMGLQTDAEGNFYYAKSGRHALPAVVPHHGTLLKVSKEGRKTEILATGFRAANGVCLNPDGTFFVTDQEGFWTPKNRINKVETGGFYGNMFGYTNLTDTSDKAMKQPLCWITNEFDRSPAEMIWVPENTWGPLAGSLLNTSYGMGKIYVVPHETVNGQVQGGMCALPLPTFPTGVMRPRFHPTDGHLYVCGMFAWAGNQTAPGGFYRVRYTGKPADLPIGLKAKSAGVELTFTDALDPTSVDVKNFDVKVWGLKRSKEYGSKHINETILSVRKATVEAKGKTVRLDLPDMAPTWGMEIKYRLKGAQGRAIVGVIHNTIHECDR